MLLSWSDYRGKKHTDQELKEEALKALKSEAPEEEREDGFSSAEVIQSNVASKLNEASQEELMSLKGVGPKTAAKILAAGPFSNLEDFATKVDLHPTLVGRVKDWAAS